MLKTFKKMWVTTTSSPSKRQEHDITLAVTALMVQVMQQDDRLDEREHHAIMQGIQARFNLSEKEAEKHITLATQAGNKASDLHQFTAPLIKAYSAQERINIIQQLWSVAIADGEIDTYEEALIRKVAELIGVHHHQFIDAKIQAKASAR